MNQRYTFQLKHSDEDVILTVKSVDWDKITDALTTRAAIRYGRRPGGYKSVRLKGGIVCHIETVPRGSKR